MPLQATSGAASYDAFGGGIPVAPNYIEDVFNVWVYPGSNSATSITNGIDLSGKGGLVWTKGRTGSADNHLLIDTVRGVNKPLRSNETGGQYTETTLTAFNANGYSITGGNGDINLLNRNYVSWTLRRQPKFFDVVTYTGDGSGTGRQISHSLGSTPGCIILKSTSTAGTNWIVYHRSLAANFTLKLQSTEAAVSNAWISTVTDTYFTGSGSAMNVSGETYVAYLFAHNAGGFGLSGTDNVISCGSYTGNGSFTGTVVNLGFEPQWLMVKRTNDVADWLMFDNMRGVATASAAGNGPDARLSANDSAAENSGTDFVSFTSTGFQLANDTSSINGNGSTYIYIAIRRGPMATPKIGTSVFTPVAYSTSSTYTVNAGFPTDMAIAYYRTPASGNSGAFSDRLRGSNVTLFSPSTGAETSISGWSNYNANMLGVEVTAASSWANGNSFIWWNFRRAPGFFDEVCYTGTGATGQAINHNLGVVPELYICKRRNGSQGGDDWQVYCSYLSSPLNSFLRLVSNAANGTNTDAWQAPTSTQIKIGAGLAGYMNASGGTYVAYLFASCPGVSKVGSYTGTGATQVINCGFTGGARFVMVKRTDSTGNWMVVDTARGLVSAGDPTLYLNSTAAEVTGVDWLDPDSSGFIVNQEGTMNANVSSATYIYLAIS